MEDMGGGVVGIRVERLCMGAIGPVYGLRLVPFFWHLVGVRWRKIPVVGMGLHRDLNDDDGGLGDDSVDIQVER